MAAGKTALVLSAGGMFGAYQAGVWSILSEFFRPDIVIGASIGSLNGWAVAGHCHPDEWLQMWLSLTPGAKPRYRLPRSPLDGVMDPSPFEDWVRQIYSSFTPVVPFGAVVTELPRLKPRLVESPRVRWEHLAASCGVPGLLPLRRLDGRIYGDGGVVTALPLWAAAQMGATRIVAVNVLQDPPASFRFFVRGVRTLAPPLPPLPPEIPVVTIAPRECLGTVRDAFYWSGESARRWVDAGRCDARDKEHVIRGMF